ncbi:hypothetical protein TL16_g03682 [Triparma laevis f. inornata]|uniref:Uncharacterized protein n=1 Tax=Triparma laevis f. inornata TaxID=1714386 RepID=A0A9W7A625_9STRA|nr:hypothetical protein TL16_g03682 [Triparma laevis f. inornata]
MSSALGLEESSVYYSALLSTLSTGRTFLLSLFHLLSLLSSPFLNLSLIIFKHLKPHIILTLSNILEYERELSNELKAIQLLLLLFLLTCYMLKRYIQRKRYIPRLTSYLSSFQTRLKTHYKNFIKKVHNINSTLAFILPHITYILICLTSWKYLKPQVTWLSSGWMVPLISVVYPVFGTVSVLRGRLRVGLNWKPEIKEEVVGGSKTKKINEPSTPENLKNLGFTSPMTSPILRVGGGKRTKSFGGPNAALRLESDSDVIAAIQYWTVYGVVTSVYTGLSYLPVLAKYVVHYQGLSR